MNVPHAELQSSNDVAKKGSIQNRKNEQDQGLEEEIWCCSV